MNPKLFSPKFRFGHYPRLSHVPGPVGGTFRQVYQYIPPPDPGNLAYVYATREYPVLPLHGAGYETLGPPRPEGYGAQDSHSAYWLDQPVQNVQGGFELYGLLPPVNGPKS